MIQNSDDIANISAILDGVAQAHLKVMNTSHYDDTLSVLFSFDDKHHAIATDAVVLPPDFHARDAIAIIMRARLAELGAFAYVFLSEAWESFIPKEQKGPVVRPRDDPQRVEILHLTYSSRHGVNEERSYAIHRNPNRLEYRPPRGNVKELYNRWANLLVDPRFRGAH